jgi:retinol-binding protein 3
MKRSTHASRGRALLSACALTALGTVSCRASAQLPPQPDITVTPEMRKEVIDGALSALNRLYVFPETAKKMEAAIRKRVENKEYDSITSARTLAETLTNHLRDISHDKHLRVLYRSEPIPEQIQSEPTPAEIEQQRRQLAVGNYGFEKVERMPGNIGYLDLRGFMNPGLAGETATAAMNFLANTDALIIDLRQNGGGDPAMVAFLSTYLFGPEPVHLNDIYDRPSDTTQQFWTLPYVPGKRYAGKDVYVLTSNYTFSGAEEFSYNVKNLKRATIVGETTGGGAHPGGPQRINAHFAVWTPMGRAINPISKDNWEGKGVTPDVAIAAPQALKAAHVMALKKVAPNAADPRRKAELNMLIERLEKEQKESVDVKAGEKK